MKLDFKNLGPWIFGTEQLKRFTQDSPVMPDVWLEYGRNPGDAIDLLLEPHSSSSTAELTQAVLQADHTPSDPAPIALAYNQSHVAAKLTFGEMLRSVLPLSEWWQEHLWPAGTDEVATVLTERRDEIIAGLKEPMREQGRRPTDAGELPGTLIWFVGLVGRITWETAHPDDDQPDDEPPDGLTYDGLVDLAAEALGELQRLPPPGRPLLWAINRNRPARPALWRSRTTIKADAATLLFDLRCDDVCWAVIDSGVDAAHPAFAVRDAKGKPAGGSRVRASYDFTRLRTLLAGTAEERDTLGDAGDKQRKEIETRLRSGRAVDWGLLAEQLRVDTAAKGYAAPRHEHGTHVAGILGADWPATDSKPPRRNDIRGICPDIGIYDLRVFDDAGDGRRVRDPRRAAVHPLAERELARAGRARRQPQPVARPRGRLLRLRAHAGLRGVRAADRQRDGRRGGRGQRGARVRLDGLRHGGGVPPDVDHRPGQRERRDHGRRDAPPPAAHLRRLVLLQPRPDGRRARQAGPRRAGREDHRAGAGRRAEEPGRDEHGRAARVGRGGADPRPPPGADRPARGDQAGAVRDRDRPGPRALLPGQRRRRRAARDPVGLRRTNTMIFSLEALQAFNGDSLLVHAGTADEPVLVLVDGGPEETWSDSLRPRLDELRAERPGDGALAIDLAMISHIDDDHIAGMLALAADLIAQQDEPSPLSYEVATLWHNSFDDVLDDPEAVRKAALEVLSQPVGGDARADELRRAGRAVVASVEEGRDLRVRAKELHWGINEPFDGPVVLPTAGVRTITLGPLKLTVVCPHQRQLDRLQKEWDEWLAAHKEVVEGAAPAAAAKAKRDGSPFNLSSIVVHAECGGKTMLLTGDARDDHILSGLDEAGIAKDGKTHVDILKLPHHGSIRNMRPAFFERITADHYVISANGSDGNPDRETLDLLAAARPDDDFVLHLTNRRGEENLEQHLDAFLANKQHQNRKYVVSFREENARSLRIDLLEGS